MFCLAEAVTIPLLNLKYQLVWICINSCGAVTSHFTAVQTVTKWFCGVQRDHEGQVALKGLVHPCPFVFLAAHVAILETMP